LIGALPGTGGDIAALVKEMMVKVTEDGGTGVLAAVPGYRVAGKTGTAQKVDPVTGGYAIDKAVSSFVGFAPADDPRLVILVLLDEPKGKAYGGLIAAPVFSRVASQSLRYLKVMPTEKVTRPVLSTIAEVIDMPVAPQRYDASLPVSDLPQMPDFSGMSYRQVMQVMQNSGLNIRLRGSGRVVAQSPRPGQPIRFGNEIWVKLAPPS
jgi:cell division protein FtsI (penicillin-binding protein 3)